MYPAATRVASKYFKRGIKKMNFDNKPGFYDAKTDELIIDFNEALEKEIIMTVKQALKYDCFQAPEIPDKDKVLALMNENFDKPFYIILPHSIVGINPNCFQNQKKLVGIYGDNVQAIYENAFKGCTKLETVEMPKILYIEESAFTLGSPFLQHSLKEKDGLITINDNILFSIIFEGEKLIIPENIKAIRKDIFEEHVINSNTKEIVFPTELAVCFFEISKDIESVTLPIDFETINMSFNHGFTKVFYRGSVERFAKTAEVSVEEVIEMAKQSDIIINPYTVEEMQELNFSIDKMEFVLDRKLTLDELLNVGKSFKEVNDYFKESEMGYEF